MISYAQNFEDVMLWRALRHIRKGSYIDVGACHPVHDSVSMAFYEAGWRGTHVEPVPENANLLRQNRPDETVLEAVVSSHTGLISFFTIPESPGLSTASAEIADEHRSRGFKFQEVFVPSIPLSTVFQTLKGRSIHWLKIDVEGLESDVLKSWGSSKVRPWVVVVESTLPLTQKESYKGWEPILHSLGYRFVYFDGLNRFFVSEKHLELLPAFDTPPNVFDGFSINGTASSSFHRVLAERHTREMQVIREMLDSERNVWHQLDSSYTQQKDALGLETRNLMGQLDTLRVSAAQSEETLRAEIKAVQATSESALIDLEKSNLIEISSLQRHLVSRELVFTTELGAMHADLRSQAESHHSREQTLLNRISELQTELMSVGNERIELEKKFLAESQHYASVQADQIKQLHQQFEIRENTLRSAQEKVLRELEQERSRVKDAEQAFSAKLESLRIEIQSAAEDALNREAAFAAESQQLVAAHIAQVDKLRLEHEKRESELRHELNDARVAAKLDGARFQAIEQELSKSLIGLRHDLESKAAVAVGREQALHSDLDKVRLEAAKDLENLGSSFERVLAEIRDENRIREQDMKSQLAFVSDALQNTKLTSSQREQALVTEASQLRADAELLEAVYHEQIGSMRQELLRVQQELARMTLDSELLEETLRAQIQISGTQLAKVAAEFDASAVELHNLRAELDSKQSALLASKNCAEDLTQLGIQYSRYVDFLESQSLVRLFHWVTSVRNWFGVVPRPALKRPRASFLAVSECYGSEQPNTKNIEYKQQECLKDIATRIDSNHFKKNMEENMDIEQLLDLSDVQFVQAAYGVILKREPDSIGERTYVMHLRRGLGKVEMLRVLADSPEARALGSLRKDIKELISSPDGRGKRNIDTLLNWYARGRIQSNRIENLQERSVDSLDVIKNAVQALAGRVAIIEQQTTQAASAHINETAQELKSMSKLLEKLARPVLRVHPSAGLQTIATVRQEIRLRANQLQRLRSSGNRPDGVSAQVKSVMAEVRKKLNSNVH